MAIGPDGGSGGRGVPTGKTRRLKPSEVVFQKGDSADQMYVVIQGKIRLLPDGAGHENPGEIVASGEFFGETALVSADPRDQTAIAVEPTVLLCVSRSDIAQLVKEQPAMAGRILKKLERRAPTSGSADESPAKAGSGDVLRLEGFDSDSKYLFLKELTCPVCETRFEAEVVRESRLAVEARYPDFRVRYRDIEPLWYRYAVCPRCLCSLKRTEFEAELGPKALAALRAIKEERLARFGIFDFTMPRDRAHALTSVRCAEYCYEAMKKPALDRAVVALNLMWLHEDAGNKDEARSALKRATDLYVEAYQNDAEKRDPKLDQRLAYLIGWLSHRLYRTNQAISFISQAMKLERQGDKVVNQMVRELLPTIRKRKKTEENARPESVEPRKRKASSDRA